MARLKSSGQHADGRREAAIFAAVQGFRRVFTGFNRLLAGASGGNISMADTLTLHFVAHAGHVTPGEISAFTGLTTGAVTSMVDRLEEAGYVQRQRSTQDRRVVLVGLRPGAHPKLAGFMMDAHGEAAKMFDALTRDDVEILVGLLERLEPEPRR